MSLDALKQVLMDLAFGIREADKAGTIPAGTTAEQLLNELNSLGSADAIADFLAKHDAKGYIGEAGSCPVANYLEDKLDKGVIVTDQNITISNGETLVLGTPVFVADFINEFDNGSYPNLSLDDEDYDEDDENDEDYDDEEFDDDEELDEDVDDDEDEDDDDDEGGDHVESGADFD